MPVSRTPPPGDQGQGELSLLFHEPLLLVRLLAFATDAWRVLREVELDTAHSPELEALLRKACPNWRNPGAAADPLELIADGVTLATRLFNEALGQLYRAGRTERAEAG